MEVHEKLICHLMMLAQDMLGVERDITASERLRGLLELLGQCVMSMSPSLVVLPVYNLILRLG